MVRGEFLSGYLKTPLSGFFGLFLKTISILLFFYFLQRKQFVCFEPYFSFIECATQKSHRVEFLDIPSYEKIPIPGISHKSRDFGIFGIFIPRFWDFRDFPLVILRILKSRSRSPSFGTFGIFRSNQK